MAAYVQQAQEQFDRMVTRQGPVNDGLTFLEEKTKVKKQYIAYGTPTDPGSPGFSSILGLANLDP